MPALLFFLLPAVAEAIALPLFVGGGTIAAKAINESLIQNRIEQRKEEEESN